MVGFQMIRFSNGQAMASYAQPFDNQSVQWGSEIRPFEIWKHLKLGPFEGRISNGPAVAIAIPNHVTTRLFFQKNKHLFHRS